MKMKKMLVYLLCAACCSALLGGCSKTGNEESQEMGTIESESIEEADSNLNLEGFPIVNETITLTAYGQRDKNKAAWDEMFIFQEYEKMSNICLLYTSRCV